LQPDQPHLGRHPHFFQQYRVEAAARDLQELSEKHFNEKALQGREDWQTMTQQEIENLKSKGMVINSPDPKPFQDALRKTTLL